MDRNSATDWTGHISLSSAYGMMSVDQQVAASPHAFSILRAAVVAWAAALAFAVAFDLLGMDGGPAAVLYVALVIMSVAGVFLLKSPAATPKARLFTPEIRRILRQSLASAR